MTDTDNLTRRRFLQATGGAASAVALAGCTGGDDNGNGNGDGNGNGNGARDVDISLSPREREILALLAEGRSQKQIAVELVISPKTVATHIQHLLSKLGVHSRAEAVAAAYRRGLVEFDVHAHTIGIALVGAD